LIEKKLEMSCEMNELRKENKDTKILLYMIIHDLKHPTDSLVISVATSLEQLARAKEMLEII
jgi:light-regulated signal transduction histidine kinase (bacteriophytochrome)